MGKTFDQSLIDTANIPMSMLDPEDMADTTSEDFISLRRVQQGCHSELSNREDFPFNKYTKTIQLSKGQSTYSMPEGRITEIRIGVDNNVRKLNYDNNLSMYSDMKSAPTRYDVTYNPNKIRFYPTPDKSYTVNIDYFSTKNVILTDNSYSYNIEIGSTLRMPEQYQHLYFDALEYYVLAENMRKVSNPRFEPTLALFREKWRIFLRGCQPIDSETVFTI